MGSEGDKHFVRREGRGEDGKRGEEVGRYSTVTAPIEKGSHVLSVVVASVVLLLVVLECILWTYYSITTN